MLLGYSGFYIAHLCRKIISLNNNGDYNWLLRLLMSVRMDENFEYFWRLMEMMCSLNRTCKKRAIIVGRWRHAPMSKSVGVFSLIQRE